MKHPNAYAAALTSALATVAVWLAKRWLGYDLTPEWAAIIAGAATAGVLFVGRRGIKGTLAALWTGGLVAWSGTGKK